MTAYTRRLAAAANAHDADLAACRRWRFPAPTPAVVRTAGGLTNDEFHVNATIAQMFAIFQAGRTRAVYGRDGDNLGVTMKTLGRDGARGVKDPATKRAHELLLTASTWTQLNQALVKIAKALKASSTGAPWDTPDWDRLHTDLTRWCDPAQRDQVRLEWGQGFVAYRPRKTSDTEQTTPTTTEEPV
jgi:CRISPR type I-E-associated protein CasB/Cse2